jgi:hypothetical protein
MSHSETEIPIISGYKRLEYVIDDGRTVKLPSHTLLQELVNFPKVDKRYPDPSDPFNVDYYRFRNREVDLDNQLILQERSNWIVYSLYQQSLNLPPFEKALYFYCNRHNIDFESVLYRFKLISYCQKLLPGKSANPDKNSKLITAFSGMKPVPNNSNERIYDFEGSLKNSEYLKYLSKLDSSFESKRRRFSEFNDAYIYLENLARRPSFDDELHQIILEQGLLITQNNERQKKRRTKARNKKNTGVDKDGMNLDYRILTQCLFCNRFHLQEPKSALSRYCLRPECILKNKAWLQSLKNGHGMDINTETISLSGF